MPVTAVNGIPSCLNAKVNNDLVRDSWGLADGVIVSDCGAIGDTMSSSYINKHFDGTPETQAAQAVKAGCDYNCGTFYDANLKGALEKGVLAITDIDRSASRLLKLGYFRSVGFSSVCTVWSRAIEFRAQQAASTRWGHSKHSPTEKRSRRHWNFEPSIVTTGKGH